MPRISPPPVDLHQVARAFDLGALQVIDFHPGSAGAWQIIETGSTRSFSLKVQPLDAPQHQIDQLVVSGNLERKALAAGLPIVPPLLPITPAIGLTAQIGDHYIWIHEWISTTSESIPNNEMQQWVGQTLARMHLLITVGDEHEADLRHACGIHPIADWEHWFREAREHRLSWTSLREEALGLIEEATALVDSALNLPDLARCVTQRDLTPVNVIHGPNGPLLADFGYAGVDVAWFELVAASSRFPGSGALTAYLESGGVSGPQTNEALAGVIGPTLNWLGYQMWVSLGHRGGTDAWRAQAEAQVGPVLDSLRDSISNLDQLRTRLLGI